MRRCVALAGALGMALSGVVSMPADAADAPVVLAGPGAARTGEWATSIVPARVGDRPLLVNGDTVWHDLASTEMGPDERPWCTAINPSKPEHPTSNPRRHPIGECPLFWAAPAIVPAGRSTVLGLEYLQAGRVYEFRCTIFPEMSGALFVL